MLGEEHAWHGVFYPIKLYEFLGNPVINPYLSDRYTVNFSYEYKYQSVKNLHLQGWRASQANQPEATNKLTPQPWHWREYFPPTRR
jgi:hypothetical protein